MEDNIQALLIIWDHLKCISLLLIGNSHVEKGGQYKLDVVNLHYFFEPV
jgi:hypothetical protein